MYRTKALAAVAALLSACSAAPTREVITMSQQSVPSGWGAGTPARLHLSRGVMLFANGRLGTGEGSELAVSRNVTSKIDTISRFGSRWVSCGVVAENGYVGNGIGPLTCHLIDPDGEMHRLARIEGAQAAFRYDVSGDAQLVAAGRDILRFTETGEISTRWQLRDGPGFRQTLILGRREIATLSTVGDGLCQVTRIELNGDGSTSVVSETVVRVPSCGGFHIARDPVSDALWLTATGDEVIAVDPTADAIGLDRPIQLGGRLGAVFSASDGLLVVSAGRTGAIGQDQIIVYDTKSNARSAIQFRSSSVVGLAYNFSDPGQTSLVTFDGNNYITSAFSRNGALVYEQTS